MISNLDAKVMDANAEALGISVEALMGNAGKAVADYLIENYHGKRFAFVCGHGNNGGDGFAAAGQMKEENVRIFLIDPVEKIRSPVVKGYLDKSGIKPEPLPHSFSDVDVLVDCGLGTGQNGDLREAYADFVFQSDGFDGVKISVDMPTGFGSNIRFCPDITLTLHDVKQFMERKNCGNIVVLNIGMPEEASDQTGPGDFLRYPIPEKNSHKGRNGELLIIGGGPYFGAPALAAMAALRIGTDLVTVAVPESVYHEVACTNPTLMVHKVSGDHFNMSHFEELSDLAVRCGCVLLGPGIGTDPETVEFVKAFAKECSVPMVVDADGLNALGKKYKAPHRYVILTPHHKEYERIGGKEDDVYIRANVIGCTILLKGPTDLISDGKRLMSNKTGCAAMTGAGTGDVLAGITAGLLSKGMEPYDSACLAAYISGKAGEKAFEKKSYGLIATDVVDCISDVLVEHLNGRN
jgi:NAD(P)H-hydrate epimerase